MRKIILIVGGIVGVIMGAMYMRSPSVSDNITTWVAAEDIQHRRNTLSKFLQARCIPEADEAVLTNLLWISDPDTSDHGPHVKYRMIMDCVERLKETTAVHLRDEVCKFGEGVSTNYVRLASQPHI